MNHRIDELLASSKMGSSLIGNPASACLMNPLIFSSVYLLF